MDRNGRPASKAAHEVGERFTAAQHLHQIGQVGGAERLYREILIGTPNHLGALHGLGLLALQAGHGDAVALLERAVAQGKRVPQLRYHLGLAYRGQRRLDEAARAFTEALGLAPGMVEADCALAALSADRGRLDEAAARFRRLLAARPAHAEALTGLGGVLLRQGSLEAAVASFREAAELLPQVAEAQANYAKALKDCGRLDEAAAAYERALALKPDAPQFRNDLGSVRAAQGRTDAAIEQYRQALAVAPSFAQAHYNLGNALKQQEKLDEAVAQFRQAVQLRPNFAEAHYNLAQTLFATGEIAMALAHASTSRDLLDTIGCRSLIVQCLARSDLQQTAGSLEKPIIRALDEAWSGANVLSIVSVMLLRRDPAIIDMLDRVEAAWPEILPAATLFGADGRAALAGNKLLDCLLRNVVICDIGFERLLSSVRAALLEAALSEAVPADGELGFHSALARQCFITEYVYAETPGQAQGIGRLRDSLVAALRSGAEVAPLALAALAAHLPLAALEGSEKLLDRSWPEPISALLDQQLRAPLEERAILPTIPALTPIEGEVSRAVQRQYEENPYPRWVAPAAEPGASDAGADRLAALREAARARGAAIDILIAGCGTGQHSIEIARRYSEARILAIDLSRASLAYAIRMAKRLGLKNLEHGQADLLALGDLDRRFDNIESVGVLHHLGDPQAGLRVLVGLLKPNGLIRLGLYSELARRSIVAARAFIAERGYGSSVEEIRRCRQDLAAAAERGRFDKFMRSGDFFSVSGVRDLLFHVQEHRFTIPMLRDTLAASGLRFLGFDLSNDLARQYRSRFPEDPAMTDLDRWHSFETENPDSFTAMYQFWAQKPEHPGPERAAS